MKTVLAIVESLEMAQLLRQAFGGKYALTVCSDPAEGAALLQKRPDGLILSLLLPGTDGLTFLKRYAPSLPPVVIGLTAFWSPAVMQAAARLGVGCLIRIPCIGALIASRLEALLSKKDPSLSGG